ncbi:MAG: glycosyltransferase [Nanoarchaeota archaeon]|nr:glycosyltransferase [Nanoarchaeota archaeon]
MRDRVLLVPGYLGEFGEIDGEVIFYKNLIDQFEKHREKVDILYYGPEDKTIDSEGGLIRHIQHRPRIPLVVDKVGRQIDFSLIWNNLETRLRPEEYSIVQTSTPDAMGLYLAKRIAKKNNIPMVSIFATYLDHFVRDRTIEKIGNNLLGRFAGELSFHAMRKLMDKYFKMADLVLAPTHHVVNDGRKSYKINCEVGVLGRGVDTELFNPSKRTRKSLEETVVLYVGQVIPDKNLHLLIEIFSDPEIKNREDLKLKVVGNGSYLEKMKKALPNAEFTGLLYKEDLAETYANADIFVNPSGNETLGQVTREASSSGLPVLVSDRGASYEVVEDEKTGFVCSDNEFKERITQLADNPLLREIIGNHGREFVKKNTWENIFLELQDYYKTARENKKNN